MTAFSLNDMNNFRDDVMSQLAPFPLLLGRELERRQFRDLWKLKIIIIIITIIMIIIIIIKMIIK